MGLLQDPIKSIEQVEWYLTNHDQEKFPGAFELAAGNLCRQTLEQILFILCCFSRMPKKRYVRPNGTLKTVGQLLKELDSTNSSGKETFWECARQRGLRIRKFARYPRTLKRWQRELNEPSHFSMAFRAVEKSKIRDFITRTRAWFDDKDKYLLVAATNEVYSGGEIKATLSEDYGNTPGMHVKLVLTASNIYRNDSGELTIKSPPFDHAIISSSEVPRGPWPGIPVIVEKTEGMTLNFQFITETGKPININSFEDLLLNLSKTESQRMALEKRFRELGCEITFQVQEEVV